MAKIKFTSKELKRLSLILEKEIRISKNNKENIKNQNFEIQERKENLLMNCDDEIQFLKLMKEKVDSETFLRNG